MRFRVIVSACLVVLLGGGWALAQTTDLSNGVFIAHAPAGLQYTTDPPSGGWCGAYTAIDSCSEQVNHVDTEGAVVWYVLSAWTESKQWCGAQFGFGDYDADNFVIEDHGACFPGSGMTIPTSGWPGPNEGIALTTTDENWEGNFVPLYWFAGYAYGEDVIPLGPGPGSDFAGWARCEDHEETAAVALGAMGIFTDGVYVCPGGFDQEAVVMFPKGIVAFSPGVTQGSVESANIASAEVDSLLTEYSVQLVKRTFPTFDRSDTLATSRTGESVALANRTDIYTLLLPLGRDPDSLVTALSISDDVLLVQRNARAVLDQGPGGPNDTYFEAQWQLWDPSFWHINAVSAWEVTTGSSSTKIAVLDSGIYRAHYDLDGKVSGDYGYHDGHGTEVASVIGALTNNGSYIAGVDWNAQLVSIRMDWHDADEYPGAFQYASLDEGAQILNCSWHVEADEAPLLELAVADVYKLNCTTVAAMGGVDPEHAEDAPGYPAAFGQWVIAVGATGMRGEHLEDSRIGAHIDVSAPGEAIYALTTDEPLFTTHFGGTSAAAAHVAGLAGLLLAQRSDLYNDDIQQLIRLGAVHPQRTEWDEYYGTGIIDARRALDLLEAPFALEHCTAAGGTEYAVGGYGSTLFIGVPGLDDGRYYTRRHEVRRSVVFDPPFEGDENVWGRGAAMQAGGWSEHPTFGEGWCEPVPGTVTNEGCTLRTYVYEVWDRGAWPPEDFEGYFPCQVNAVRYEYTTLGRTEAGDVAQPEEQSKAGLRMLTPEPSVAGAKWVLTLGKEGSVAATVHDVAGRVIREVVKGRMTSGAHAVAWDGTDEGGNRVGAGVYFLTVDGPGLNVRSRVVIVR